jgi:hypothetical protein
MKFCIAHIPFIVFILCWSLLLLQAGGSSGLLMDLAANEKAVHADFFNGKPIYCCNNTLQLISLNDWREPGSTVPQL